MSCLVNFLQYRVLKPTAGIQFIVNEIRKYTSPSWNSNFHRSVRAVCFLCNAAAVNDKIMKSKTIASEAALVLLNIKMRRWLFTEEENSVK